jgi:ribosomal protein L4
MDVLVDEVVHLHDVDMHHVYQLEERYNKKHAEREKNAREAATRKDLEQQRARRARQSHLKSILKSASRLVGRRTPPTDRDN